MKFKITLTKKDSLHTVIPLNYQYAMSAAIYKILARGDKDYARFLHEKGYGKGFKLFTFSQLNVPFKIEGAQKDRMRLIGNEAHFQIAFHLPEAMENFVKGLFQNEQIDIADKKSKGSFKVKSVESLPNPL